MALSARMRRLDTILQRAEVGHRQRERREEFEAAVAFFNTNAEAGKLADAWAERMCAVGCALTPGVAPDYDSDPEIRALTGRLAELNPVLFGSRRID